MRTLELITYHKMTFRKEDKFRLSEYDIKILKINLIREGMTHLFPKRLISSVYFDNKLFSCYQDSEEGLLPRKKIRIRHYPESNKENFNLEEKTSSIEGRFKTTRNLSIDQHNILLKNGILDRTYGLLKPVTKIEYYREYYSLHDLRLTFDNNIYYSYFNSSRIIKETDCVMEIKSSITVSNDYIESLIPFPKSRFSKYSNAIRHIF